MSTCWTCFRSFCTYMYITTVAALPYSFFSLLEYSTVFDVVHKSQVSFFVCLFSYSDVAIHDSNCWKTFSISYISKVRIVSSPFFVFTSCSSLQVFGSCADNTCRIRSCDFYHTTFQPLEHTLSVFFFLVSCFCKDSSNLFVTFFLCYTCKVCITHSCL